MVTFKVYHLLLYFSYYLTIGFFHWCIKLCSFQVSCHRNWYFFPCQSPELAFLYLLLNVAISYFFFSVVLTTMSQSWFFGFRLYFSHCVLACQGQCWHMLESSLERFRTMQRYWECRHNHGYAILVCLDRHDDQRVWIMLPWEGFTYIGHELSGSLVFWTSSRFLVTLLPSRFISASAPPQLYSSFFFLFRLFMIGGGGGLIYLNFF